jgi:hypothetical protein
MKRSRQLILVLLLVLILVGSAACVSSRPRLTPVIELLGNKDVATLNIVDDAERLGWEASVSGYSAWTTPEGERVSRNSYTLTNGDIYIIIQPQNIRDRGGLDAPLNEPLIEIIIPHASSLNPEDLSQKTVEQVSKVLLDIGIIEEFSLENAMVQLRENLDKPRPTMLIDLLGNKDVATLNIVDDAKGLGWDTSVSGYSGWTTPEGQWVSRDFYHLTKGDVYMTISPIDERKGPYAPLDEPLIEIFIPGASFLDDLSQKTVQQISKLLVGIGIIEEFSLDKADVQVRYDVILQQPGWKDRIWPGH